MSLYVVNFLLVSTNTPAYNATESIMAVKKVFMTSTPVVHFKLSFSFLFFLIQLRGVLDFLLLKSFSVSEIKKKWYCPYHCLKCLLVHTLCLSKYKSIKSGKSYCRGRVSTVDLLILTGLGQLLFKLKILFTFYYKTSYLLRSTVLLLGLEMKLDWIRVLWSLN